MPSIHLLDDNTINQIAAGEVIERPSSVVKELVENALDAGATAITVEIKGGGIDLVRVTDNGCGIEKEQIPLAFERHATSKLYQIDDLVHISSLGFRGEALASIAAVAQVEMITKTADSLLGVSYRIEEGRETDVQEIGAPDGTTILVRNLFYHLPARRKFLKSPDTEAGYVIQLMELLAFIRPDVSLRLISNGQNRLYTAGNNRLKDVIYTVYGREIQANLIEVNAETELVKVSGYIGKPIISRGNRSFENYFINGRYVKNRVISGAIESAYKSYLMLHRYPFTALHLELSGELVDVNVHPAKLEVRFSAEQEIFAQLEAVIRTALEGREYIPDAADSEKVKLQPAPAKKPEPFEKRRLQAEQEILPPPPAKTSERFAGAASGMNPERRLREGGLRWAPEAAQPEKNPQQNACPVPGSEEQETDQKPGLFAAPEAQEVPEQPGLSPQPVTQEASNEPGLSIQPDSAAATKQPLPVVAEEDGQYRVASAGENRFLSEQARAKHRLIGQVFSTYWLMEYDDRLYIMDQHAAHEKVNYEKLLREYHEQQPASQILSPAMIVTLSASEERVLNQYLSEFTRIGYEIEAYGGKEYAITAVPANLPGVDEKDLFSEMLAELEVKGSLSASEAVCQKIASISCKASVKGGQKLSFAEADALIDQLMTLDNPYMCPHGRPTLISLTKTELEKKFRRIV